MIEPAKVSIDDLAEEEELLPSYMQPDTTEDSIEVGKTGDLLEGPCVLIETVVTEETAEFILNMKKNGSATLPLWFTLPESDIVPHKRAGTLSLTFDNVLLLHHMKVSASLVTLDGNKIDLGNPDIWYKFISGEEEDD